MSLISTDGLESSLREILEAVARQSTELKNLRAEVSACATRADVSTVQREISARLSSVEARLDRLEAETHLDLPFDAALGIARESSEGGVVGASVDARVPLSRFVLAHDASLRALTRASELAATREELAASSRMASDALRDAGLRAAEDFASRSALDASAAAVSAQSAELAALQGVVATKVDRGEWAAVQAVAADVAGFGGFRAAAGAELRELGARSDEHRAALDRSLESTAKLSAVVQALAGATAQKADARELRGLSASVEHIAAELGRAASADDLRMASNALASVTARATALEAASREITRAAADDRRAVDARVQAAAASLRADIAGAAAKFEQQCVLERSIFSVRARASSYHPPPFLSLCADSSHYVRRSTHAPT